jgi:hypothetical protein
MTASTWLYEADSAHLPQNPWTVDIRPFRAVVLGTSPRGGRTRHILPDETFATAAEAVAYAETIIARGYRA